MVVANKIACGGKMMGEILIFGGLCVFPPSPAEFTLRESHSTVGGGCVEVAPPMVGASP